MPLLNCCSLLFSLCHVPTLMHCTPRTQIPRISWLHKITDPNNCERLSQTFGIGSNGSDYPLEKESSVRTARAIRSKKMSSVQTARVIRSKKTVIRSNGLSYPLKTIVSRATVPNHFRPSRLLRTCQEIVV